MDPYDKDKTSQVGNWPPAWKLKYLNVKNAKRFEKLKMFMDYIEGINLGLPDYEGPFVSGKARWALILNVYMMSHGNNVTTPHSLRSKWSRGKTAMEKLLTLNARIKAGKVPTQYAFKYGDLMV